MKYLLIALSFSTVVYAQDDLQVLNKGLKVIQNPTSSANNLCDENGTKSTAWCESLFTSVCAVKKTANKKVDDYASEISKRFEAAMPENVEPSDVTNRYYSNIKAAEAETAARTKITTEDLMKIKSDVSSSLIRLVNDSPLGGDRKKQMVDFISAVDVMTPMQMIEKEKARLKKNNPDMSENDILMNSVSSITDKCGYEGMYPNAVFSPEYNSIIVCPGLVQSISEFGSKKEDIINGLSFTIGHEIAHSIDGGVMSYNVDESTYDNMRMCYRAEDPKMRWQDYQAEIVADFWASKVLAERLKTQGVVGKDAMMNVALSIDGLCETPGDADHPSTEFRVNNILSRNPQLRAQLECGAPTPEKPYCGVDGAQPAKVASVP